MTTPSQGPPGPYQPYKSPIPNVASYGTAGVQAMSAYNKALASINQQRGSLLNQYGYAGNINGQTGELSNLRVDPGNQVGQYQQMLRNDAQQSMQAHDANAGAGRIGGLGHQAESQLQWQHGINSNQLGQNMLGGLYGLDQQQSGAADTAYNSAWQQAQTEMQNSIMAGMFNPANMQGITVPEYGTYSNDPYSTQNPPTANPPSNPLSTLLTGGNKAIGTSVGKMAARTIAPAFYEKNKTLTTPRRDTLVKKVVANAYTSGKKARG